MDRNDWPQMSAMVYVEPQKYNSSNEMFLHLQFGD